MILTVTLNPAIDVTYHVDVLVPGETHRVSRVDERLGGKGVNVAGVLEQLGVPVVSTGLLRDGPASFAPIAAAPRRTVVVADGQNATGFWEPGPVVTPAEWAHFTAVFANLLPDMKVVVFSGSLPGGLPAHAYASLISLARHAGCRTILDTSGSALAAGLTAAPDIIKPNTSELATLTSLHTSPSPSAPTALTSFPSPPAPGAPPRPPSLPVLDPDPGRGQKHAGGDSGWDPDRGAAPRGAGAVPRGAGAAEAAPSGRAVVPPGTTVVSSHGPQGLRARGVWARPPRAIAGNPTGAGDACVAALAQGLLLGTPWPTLLRDAVALSAAAVAAPVAGRVDLDLYRELLPEVIVEES